MADQRVAGVTIGQHPIMRGVIVPDEEISLTIAVEHCDGLRKIINSKLSP